MKTDSGVGVRFWFHMLVAAADASNATYKPRLDSTWNGNNNGGKKRKFFENNRGGGNSDRRDDKRDDRFSDKQIYQHSAMDYGRGSKEHQGAMALVVDDWAMVGNCNSDPKPQMFIGGTSDYETETGAKMIHKYRR